MGKTPRSLERERGHGNSFKSTLSVKESSFDALHNSSRSSMYSLRSLSISILVGWFGRSQAKGRERRMQWLCEYGRVQGNKSNGWTRKDSGEVSGTIATNNEQPQQY